MPSVAVTSLQLDHMNNAKLTGSYLSFLHIYSKSTGYKELKRKNVTRYTECDMIEIGAGERKKTNNNNSLRMGYTV